MRCDRVQILLGVHEEIDRTTRRAVEQHLSACHACASAWSAELEFRQLMTARRRLPVPREGRRSLMVFPPPGATRARWEARAQAFGPVVLVVAALAVAATYAANGQTRADPIALAPVAATSEPTAVRRLFHPATAEPLAAAPARVAAPSADEAPPAGAPPAAPAPVITLATDAVAAGALPPPPAPTAQQSQGQPGAAAPTASPPSEVQPSPSPPPPTQGPVTTILIQAATDLAGGAPDCPGCDGIGPDDLASARDRPVGDVIVAVVPVDAQGARGEALTVTLSPVDPAVAAGRVVIPAADSYIVIFEVADGGFELCAGQLREVVLRGGSDGDGDLVANFRLWTGCPIAEGRQH